MKTLLAIALAAAALGWFGPTLAPAASGPEPAVQQAGSPADQDLTEPEGKGERSFTLSTDPETVVLRAEYFTDGAETAVFSLHGDGRLMHESTKRATREVYDRAEMQLEAAERERLVRFVVDGGLLECGPDCIDARCVPEDPNVRPPSPHCLGVELTVNLEAYKPPGELTPRQVQRRIVHPCAEWVIEACREIVEPYALDGLRRRLFRYRRTMWQGRRADFGGEPEPSSRTTRGPGSGSPGQAGGTATKAAEGERSFTLSTDPEEVVLEYSHPSRLGIVAFKLYGDGRLVYEPGQRDPSRSAAIEMHLGLLEQERLVRTVLDAGILECGPECIEARCALRYGLHRIAPASDCGGVTLSLNLKAYSGPGESSPAPVQQRMYQQCPQDVAELCPEIQELDGIRELGRALYQQKEAAQEVEP